MKFQFQYFSACFFLSLLARVAGHGQVMQVTIDGQPFAGNLPGGSQVGSSIVRLVTSGDPIKGATNPDINCGRASQVATEVAQAMPGSVLAFKWTGESGQVNWPHDTGPMLTYLASCGDTTCDKFDSSGAKWFKIEQSGRTSAGGPWAQAAVQGGSPATVTLPINLAAGSYLVRHEIIALQGAVSVNGAEFYPSCSQISVGGSETGAPLDSELVSFPGAYSDDDPGIHLDVYTDPSAPYTFPGPPIASFITGSTTTNPSSPVVSVSRTASAVATPTASATTKSGKTCLIRRAPVVARVVPREHRRFSRIMKKGFGFA
ncbi:glycoside hydrolase family 61 protein [Mycena floridula]|nr:glycoside hydrolase family 61 protein [Mycena floridula]